VEPQHARCDPAQDLLGSPRRHTARRRPEFL